jgi:hypothetical protein
LKLWKRSTFNAQLPTSKGKGAEHSGKLWTLNVESWLLDVGFHSADEFPKKCGAIFVMPWDTLANRNPQGCQPLAGG